MIYQSIIYMHLGQEIFTLYALHMPGFIMANIIQVL